LHHSSNGNAVVPLPCGARPLHWLAWLNVVLHVLGLVLAAVGMRPGTPAVPLTDRMAYLASDPSGWVLGGCVWMRFVPALVTFFLVAARHLGDNWPLAPILLVGAAFDIFCDSAYILVLPFLASRSDVSTSTFLAVEKLLGIGSLVVANGFYSVATLLM